MDEQLIRPPEPDPLIEDARAFWRDIGKNLVRESIRAIDEAAKQIIGVAGVLEGLYFHAITFTDLRGELTNTTMFIYLIPIAVLLLSLICAIIVFVPNRSRLNFNSSEASKIVYEDTISGKLLAIRFASLFLILGIAAIFLSAFTYLRG